LSFFTLRVEAGKTINIKRSALLYTDQKGLNLEWTDEIGMNWGIEGLKPGKYLLRLHYNPRRLPMSFFLICLQRGS
jgi:hypothetical protein